MRNGDTLAQRTPLRDDRALTHEEGACLPLRSTFGRCRACEQACPVGALAVSLDAVSLNDSCMACGRCVGACPTQALMLPGLDTIGQGSRPGGDGVRRIECSRVPERWHRGSTQVVPCLGAVSAGHLLEHAARGTTAHCVDRGWCTTCVAGGEGPHPAQSAVDMARLWLESVEAESPPALVHEPLDEAASLAPRPQPPRAEPVLDRRRFFAHAVQRPAGRDQPAPVPMGSSGRAAYPASERRAAPERERQLTALGIVAERNGRSLPAEIFPTLRADTRCCDRRLCVAVCPTAALTAIDSGEQAWLQWSAERCIACGACERACPESALVLQPHGGTPGLHTLAAHVRRSCADCGEAFTPASADDQNAICPACRKSRRFIDDARRQLFGAPT